MNADHIFTSRWTEALGLMAFPPNAPSSLKLLANLVDEMWFHAGDTSADVSGKWSPFLNGQFLNIETLVFMVHQESPVGNRLQVYGDEHDSR